MKKLETTRKKINEYLTLFLFFSRPRNEGGQSLISVLMGVALTSIILLGIASMQSSMQKAAAATQTLISRNMIQLIIQQSLLKASSLTNNTMINDTVLMTCVYGGNCTAVSSPGNNFKLYDPQGNQVAGLDGGGNPIRYDYTGALCTVASPQCIFEVLTTYTATCSGPSPCVNAQVAATFTIQQTAGITPVGGTPLKKISNTSPLLSPQGPTKAFVRFDGTTCTVLNASCTLLESQNVASVVRISAPYQLYLLTFINPLSTPNYVFNISAGISIPASWEYPLPFLSDAPNKLGAGTGTGSTTTTFEFGLFYYNGLANGGWADFSNISVIIFSN